jgi:hypothetical protein
MEDGGQRSLLHNIDMKGDDLARVTVAAKGDGCSSVGKGARYKWL